VNVFQQRGMIGAVLRVIPLRVMSIEQLNLPRVVEKLATEQRGLILVTGTTGSGKSTTLAAMIDHINSTDTCHIMTVEDPIEFIIRDKRSIVNQREVGVDTHNFAQALKGALRQDPDVILVGEMRDLETIETALTAAETGHLVMSTLHTMDATETIQRIVSVFPPFQQKQVRLQLGSVLKGIISQRIPAIEVLVATGRVRELIEDESRTQELHDAIAEGNTSYGMQTFDQSLMAHLKAGLITYEEALRQTTNPDDFALRCSGISGTSDSRWDAFEKAPEQAPPEAGPRPPAPVTGSAAPRGTAVAPPRPAGGAAGGSPPVAPVARIALRPAAQPPAIPGAGRPAAASTARPAAPAPDDPEDDFSIERF
jgi:twitching motility protein PilT